jgi:hypothetical protein
MHREGLKLARQRLWNNTKELPRPEDIKKALDGIRERQSTTMLELQASIRSGLLGMDRRWNKYWVCSEKPKHPGEGTRCRVVMEASDGSSFVTLKDGVSCGGCSMRSTPWGTASPPYWRTCRPPSKTLPPA